MAEAILDMSNPITKSRVVERIKRLEGRWRFDVRRYRPRRSDRQNRFYWPCIVQPFGRALREAGNNFTDDDAHEMLKNEFLQVTHVDERTGRRMTCTRSTTKLDTAEFADYVDQCAAYLSAMDIYVPAPNEQTGSTR